MSTQAVAEQETRSRKQNGRAQEERQRRRRRSDHGLGRISVLDVANKDPAYAYRWINDDPGRIQQLTEQDDWDIVQEDDAGGRTDKDRSSGTNVERIVDRSTGKRAVLVRKRKDFYEEDKARAQAQLDQIDDAIKRGQATSPDGLQGPHAYVPSGGIVVNDGRKG